MEICPTCGREAEYLVTNVQTWTEFCPGCAPPSFSIHSVLTMKDLDFMKACGIDPKLPDVLQPLVDAVTAAKKP